MSQRTLLNTPQQELISFDDRLLSSYGAGLAFSMGRACVVQCAAIVSQELGGAEPITPERLADIAFLMGAHREPELADVTANTYEQGKGWNWIQAGQGLRDDGVPDVIVQNMTHGVTDTDVSKALAAGRVTTHKEMRILDTLAAFGGTERADWLRGIKDKVLQAGGLSVVSIRIPTNNEATGGHAVIVRSIEDGVVPFFDSDKWAIDRYVENGFKTPGITRTNDPEQLNYTQPFADFAERMSGECIHCLPRESSTIRRKLGAVSRYLLHNNRA